MGLKKFNKTKRKEMYQVLSQRYEAITRKPVSVYFWSCICLCAPDRVYHSPEYSHYVASYQICEVFSPPLQFFLQCRNHIHVSEVCLSDDSPNRKN